MECTRIDIQNNNRQSFKSEPPFHKDVLRSQDRQVHRRLYVATALILLLALIIIIHEIFVLMKMPQSGVHSVAHVLLLLMVAVIIVSTIILWRSYKTLSQYQTRIITNHETLEETIRERTRALDRTESLLGSIFNAFDERIVAVDAETRIIRANKAAIAQAGYDPAGHLFAEVFPGCDPASERRSESRLIKNTFDTASGQRNRMIRGGMDCASVLSIDTYPVLNRRGDARLVIEVARDVTKEMENDILARHREKMAALGMLSAGFAHEFGNPLASLSTELELLERNPDKSTINETTTRLREHLNRITRILQQIRDFAQKRSNATGGTMLDKVIHDALHLVSFDPRAQGVSIDVDIPDGLGPVHMHEDDLHLVVINLILNAFEAMRDGGTLTITAKSGQSGGSCLTVSDTGVGMEREVLSQATFPFFTTKHESSGMGLGLSLCTDLLHTAGAMLNISSTTGMGTTVRIDFPSTVDRNRQKQDQG